MAQSIHGGFVHIAVQPYQGESLGGQTGQGVLKPTFQKNNLWIEQIVSSEIFLYLLARNSQKRILIVSVAGIGRVIGGVRFGQASERISDKNFAVLHPIRFEN